MTDLPFKRVAASENVERFYQTMCAHLLRECDADPSLRNAELIAVIGRMAGYCVAMCHPQERDLVRAMAIENIDKGTKAIVDQMADAAQGDVSS